VSKKSLRAIAVITGVVATLFAMPVQAQNNKGKNDDAKLREREKTRAERDARRYEKLKAFALNLYQTDPEFREEVDERFDQVQREHSEKAYHNNVARLHAQPSSMTATGCGCTPACTTTRWCPITSIASASG
jgi:hypothetical protein